MLNIRILPTFLIVFGITFSSSAENLHPILVLDSIPTKQRDAYRIAENETCNNVVSGVGLPIWVMGGIGTGDYVFDWRGSTKTLRTIGSSPISTENRETAVAIDECGKPAFYLMHTGQEGNRQLDIYSMQGLKLTDLSTPAKYPLNGSAGNSEIQVIRIPHKLDEWYIIYSLASGSLYDPAKVAYSKVKYSSSAGLTIQERDVLISNDTYVHGKALSAHVEGDENKHYLYLATRQSNIDFVRFHRFIVDENGIHSKQQSGNNIPANWWNLSVHGSPLELSHDGNLLGFLNRSQSTSTSYQDLIIFDTRRFTDVAYTPIIMNVSNLLVTFDWGGTTITKSINELATQSPYSNIYSCFSLIKSKLSDIEFSPSGKYLYIVGGGVTNSTSNTYRSYLGQIDLESGGNSSIKNIRLQVQKAVGTESNCQGISASTAGKNFHIITKINAGYDGHLYFTKTNENRLFVIPFPDCEMPQELVPYNVDLSTNSVPNIEVLASNNISVYLPEAIDGYKYIKTPWDDAFQLSEMNPAIGQTITLSGSFLPSQYDYYAEWGDGTVDKIEGNASHAYSQAGNYSVVLTRIGPEGCAYVSVGVVKVESCAALSAKIQTNHPTYTSININEICIGDKIVFQNKSINGITFQWNFGDGTTLNKSNTDDIVHQYLNSGSYEV
jgi:hypothetical protein